MNRTTVDIECPVCREARPLDAAQVKYRTKLGTFTGRCYRHRLFQIVQRGRLPRPHHSSVDWSDTAIEVIHGKHLTRVHVTCPKCESKRLCNPGSTAASIRSGRFTGLCLPCSPKAKKREWVELSPGRKINPAKGYVRVAIGSLSGRERELADAMRRSRPYALEHRLVMAVHLDRPLESHELVDHMDGVKTNNDLVNLRIYLRGKNQPGSGCGYGTYYDEWQRALARIRELEGA